MRKYYNWFRQSWPLPLVPIALAVYYLLSSSLPGEQSTINNWYGAALQILGGLQILWSIDKNLRGFKNQSIIRSILEWFRSFPLFAKPRSAVFTGAGGIVLGGSAKIITGKHVYSTIAERVEYLERQIDLLQEEFKKRMDEFGAKVNKQRKDLEVQIAHCNEKISEAKNLIEDVALGDIKGQVTGILIVIMGTWMSALR
jgi:hypothetical protein